MHKYSSILASRVLDGPLTVALLVLALVRLAMWAPHFLMWPWHQDIDVFCNQAMA